MRHSWLARCPLPPALVLLAAAASAASAPPTAPAPAPVGSFAELLDPAAAARLKGWTTHQASGYDRGGGFYDSGNFLREEPGRRYVLLETRGPGCIDRMWFTRKTLREPYDLLLYLDDPRRPALRIDLDALCAGTRPPFVAPFVGSVNLARYCLVPIAFRRYCKAVLVPTAPAENYQTRENSAGKQIPHVYYQITYRRAPAGTPLRPFRETPEPDERRARERAVALWSRAGEPPWPREAGERALERSAQVAPGGTVTLFDLPGAGLVRSLHLRVPGRAEAEALRLEIRWDGSPEPAVSAPLGTFFAAPDPKVEVPGLWLGARGGEYYCHLPMPFRRGARIAVRSTGAAPVPVSARVTLLARAPRPDDAALHAAAYDHRPPLAAGDYPVLDVKGRGHFIGLVMDRPGNMEGDDRFYVDGEADPSIHGTGTEDFFSFAWGFSHLRALPLHGITRHAGAPILYRFLLPAGVPFRRSLRVGFEHGHGNEHQGRYSGVAFYYLQPDGGPDDRSPNRRPPARN